MDEDCSAQPEILSYRAFREREALRAWRARWQAHEAVQPRRAARPSRSGSDYAARITESRASTSPSLTT